MPAELCQQTQWVFSHKDSAAGTVYVMSLPVSIGEKSYPLYYFYGSVPAGAVSVKN